MAELFQLIALNTVSYETIYSWKSPASQKRNISYEESTIYEYYNNFDEDDQVEQNDSFLMFLFSISGAERELVPTPLIKIKDTGAQKRQFDNTDDTSM